jgi:hypothetical protein
LVEGEVFFALMTEDSYQNITHYEGFTLSKWPNEKCQMIYEQ